MKQRQNSFINNTKPPFCTTNDVSKQRSRDHVNNSNQQKQQNSWTQELIKIDTYYVYRSRIDIRYFLRSTQNKFRCLMASYSDQKSNCRFVKHNCLLNFQ